MENRRGGIREMAAEQASSMRQQAMSIAAKRKQEYLGARVPKALREKILHQAELLGIPVSILIRNILTEYVDNLGGESLPEGETNAVLDEAGSSDQQKKFDEVIGWEKLLLNKEVVCMGCAKHLKKGDEVVFGLVPGQSHVILCERCKQLEGLG